MNHRLCAWHKMYFPGEPAPILGDFAGDGTSHGICQACRDKFEAEAVVYQASRRPALPLSREAIRRQVRENEQKKAA